MGCPVVRWTNGPGAPEKDVGCNYRPGSLQCASCQGFAWDHQSKMCRKRKADYLWQSFGENWNLGSQWRKRSLNLLEQGLSRKEQVRLWWVEEWTEDEPKGKHICCRWERWMMDGHDGWWLANRCRANYTQRCIEVTHAKWLLEFRNFASWLLNTAIIKN